MAIELKQALVVDDENMAQTILKYFLETLGYHVTVANNGQEAVSLFERDNFPLILMDFNMPSIDGPTATRIIRNLEKQKTIIIGVTAYVNEERLNEGLIAGMDLVLTKPVEQSGLKKVLTSFKLMEHV